MFALRKFHIEFLLSGRGLSEDILRRSLEGVAEETEIVSVRDNQMAKGEDQLRVYLNSDDAELVFDICSQYGRLRSVKISESRA